jgi:septation ring formation regulator
MSTTVLAIIIVCAVLFVGAIVFLAIFFGKKRYSRNSANLRNSYNDYHTTLTSDCKVMITRLGALGKYSAYYQNLHDERAQQYSDILNKRDKDMALALDSLDTLIHEKNYKEAKDIQLQCQSELNDFIKAVSTFNDDLTSLLRDDSDTREAALPDKEKYRAITDAYSKHETELKPLEKSFRIIFDNAEKVFAQFNDLANQAQFAEAKALLPKLDKILDALLGIMDQLPVLETLVSKVVPDKLSRLNQSYQEMLKEGYTLDYLDVPGEIQKMREEDDRLAKQLTYLSIEGVKDSLDQIQAHITDILVKFDDEKKAKTVFQSSQTTLSGSSFEIEKVYSRHMNQLPDYQKTYVLDTKYVDQMRALKTDIEAIGFLKRELDSYLDTSAKQPYTVITKKMSDMQSEMAKVNRTMSDYSDYLNSLKSDSQLVYQGLRKYFVELKHAEYAVRTIGVESLTKTLSQRFTGLYQRIASIDQIILTEPVDVTKALSAFGPFKTDSEALIQEVNAKAEEANKAEAAIVYANVYRQDFTDSRPNLETAEKAFNEGDFSRASSSAVAVIKNFSTDVYKAS